MFQDYLLNEFFLSFTTCIATCLMSLGILSIIPSLFIIFSNGTSQGVQLKSLISQNSISQKNCAIHPPISQLTFTKDQLHKGGVKLGFPLCSSLPQTLYHTITLCMASYYAIHS